MHPQLEAIAADYEAARERLHRLARETPAKVWTRRPQPSRWSMAECVAHLNLTSAAFRLPVERALLLGRSLGAPPPKRYRRDPIGWLLWRVSGPPARHRTRTTAPFVPQGATPLAQLLEDFDRLQDEQQAWVRAASGLPLGELRIVSPFDARIRYNLYACLTILPRHQHRHLWQAEQARAALPTPP